MIKVESEIPTRVGRCLVHGRFMGEDAAREGVLSPGRGGSGQGVQGHRPVSVLFRLTHRGH